MSLDAATAIERVKATAASHTDTYVAIHPDDVEAIISHPALANDPFALTLVGVVKSSRFAPQPSIKLDRTKHLAGLLKAVEGS